MIWFVRPTKCEECGVIWILLENKLRLKFTDKFVMFTVKILWLDYLIKVRQWCCSIREEQINVHDEEHSGQLMMIMDDSIEKVEEKIWSDALLLSQLSSMFCNLWSMKFWDKKIMCQVGAKEVNWYIQEKHLAAAHEFLWYYENEDDELLVHLVTKNETYLSYLNNKTKEQSIWWLHSSFPTLKKLKQGHSVKKLMKKSFLYRM